LQTRHVFGAHRLSLVPHGESCRFSDFLTVSTLAALRKPTLPIVAGWLPRIRVRRMFARRLFLPRASPSDPPIQSFAGYQDATEIPRFYRTRALSSVWTDEWMNGWTPHAG